MIDWTKEAWVQLVFHLTSYVNSGFYPLLWDSVSSLLQIVDEMNSKVLSMTLRSRIHGPCATGEVSLCHLLWVQCPFSVKPWHPFSFMTTFSTLFIVPCIQGVVHLTTSLMPHNWRNLPGNNKCKKAKLDLLSISRKEKVFLHWFADRFANSKETASHCYGRGNHLSHWFIHIYGHLGWSYCCVCSQIVSEAFSHLETTINSSLFPSVQAHAAVIPLCKSYLLSWDFSLGLEEMSKSTLGTLQVALWPCLPPPWPFSCCSLHGQLQPLH